MVRNVERVGREAGLGKSLWMTLGISDGKNLWGFRYGSDGKGPSLYVSPGIGELAKLNPEVRTLGEDAVCIVSEPIGNYQDTWKPIPENSKLVVDGNGVIISAFNP